jgi:hypothetical protein
LPGLDRFAFTERKAQVGIDPSVGSVGNAFDNAQVAMSRSSGSPALFAGGCSANSRSR